MYQCRQQNDTLFFVRQDLSVEQCVSSGTSKTGLYISKIYSHFNCASGDKHEYRLPFIPLFLYPIRWGEMRLIVVLHYFQPLCYLWRSVSIAGGTNCSWKWTSNLPLAIDNWLSWDSNPNHSWEGQVVSQAHTCVRWGEMWWGVVRRGEVWWGEVRWGEVGEVRWGKVRRGDVMWG